MANEHSKDHERHTQADILESELRQSNAADEREVTVGTPLGREAMEHAVHGRSVTAASAVDAHATRPGAEHAAMDHGEHDTAVGEHAGHHQMAPADHTGHEEMFRRRFWVSLLLSIPVLLHSPTL